MTKAQRIAKHVENLGHIFADAPINSSDFKAALPELERQAQRLAEDYCNRPMIEGEYERREEIILNQLDEWLGFRAAGVRVFLNSDPRGYALKISDEDVRAKKLEIHTDWGGYGIIWPDFD